MLLVPRTSSGPWIGWCAGAGICILVSKYGRQIARSVANVGSCLVEMLCYEVLCQVGGLSLPETTSKLSGEGRGRILRAEESWWARQKLRGRGGARLHAGSLVAYEPNWWHPRANSSFGPFLPISKAKGVALLNRCAAGQALTPAP